jgi:hypothetical protein
MDFRLSGLSPEPFRPLFDLSDVELRELGAVRRVAGPQSIYPCRVGLIDATPGEEVILTNFAHLPQPQSPYHSIGPIFVRRASQETWDRINGVPASWLDRPLSLRAYGGDHMLVDARLAKGKDLPSAVATLLAVPAVDYIHVHNAAHGCYACRIDRV